MMAGDRERKYRGHALPAQAVTERAGHRSSGASGVHDDQNSRKYRTGKTNRVGGRSARRQAAIDGDEA
jgi:hypothetical protein